MNGTGTPGSVMKTRAREPVKATKDRLLDTAELLYARQGIQATSLRQITDRARANLAAVNYHFRDKESLYHAALEFVIARGFQQFPPDLGLGPRPTPQDRLRAFIRSFMLRMLSQRAWGQGQNQMILRELVEQSPVLDHFIEQFARPMRDILRSIMRDLLGPKATDKAVRGCTLSVVGQCLHYTYARPIMQRLGINPVARDEEIERVADHITRFSLGGIQAVRQGRSKS